MARRGKLLAVGDVAVARANPASMFAQLGGALSEGDLLFGQLETTITNRGERAAQAKLAMRAPPETAGAIAAAGFQVMSFAGNHCMDWGTQGFADTLSHAQAAGIRLFGAGADIIAARAPVLAMCGQIKIAFLAYSSILPEDYWAEPDRAGCAPMRAHTHYEMIEPDQPGTPPRILTRPHADDLRAMVCDIENAKLIADFVTVSFHWGIHMTPVVIADYQPVVARAAIDAGAGVILGHHPHLLKGVEFYRGAPIFYSLGNFAIEQPQAFDPAITQSASFRHLLSLHPGAAPEGLYLLPEDTRKTLIAEIEIVDSRCAEVRVRPAWIDDASTPNLLAAEDPRFDAVCAFLAEASETAGFATRCVRDGDRVRLLPA